MLQRLVPRTLKKGAENGKSYIRLSKCESERWLESWCDGECVSERGRKQNELFHLRIRVEKARLDSIDDVYSWGVKDWGGYGVVKGPPIWVSVCVQIMYWLYVGNKAFKNKKESCICYIVINGATLQIHEKHTYRYAIIHNFHCHWIMPSLQYLHLVSTAKVDLVSEFNKVQVLCFLIIH